MRNSAAQQVRRLALLSLARSGVRRRRWLTTASRLSTALDRFARESAGELRAPARSSRRHPLGHWRPRGERRTQEIVWRFPSPLQPWLDFKQGLQQTYGLSIGGSEGILGQDYSNSLTDNHNAVGQKFTLNVGQQILFRGTPDVMTVEAVIEDRGPVGTEFAPLQAGLRTGSSTATAPTWGDFNLGVTQLYVRQDLLNHHFQYTFGKLFAPNYVNSYPFFDDNRQYLNQMYTTSVTIPVPLRGFGAVAALFPTNFGLYAKAGVYTIYSDDTGFTGDSFFNEPQYFRHLEFGWSGLAGTGTPIQGRGPMDANNVSLTLWNKDANPETGEAKSRGIAFNANYQSVRT